MKQERFISLNFDNNSVRKIVRILMKKFTKKHPFFRLTAAGAFLLLSTFSTIPAYAAQREELVPQMSLGLGYEGNVNLTAKDPDDAEKMASETAACSSENSFETGEPDQHLGVFRITAYCNCETCTKYNSLTYAGTVPRAAHTIAADLSRYPLGTKLLIDGIVYTVEDKGSSLIGNKIDIYFASHEEALDFGVQNLDVYTVKPKEEAEA